MTKKEKFDDLKIIWFDFLNSLIIWFDMIQKYVELKFNFGLENWKSFKFGYLNWFCKNDLNWKKLIQYKNSITETFSNANQGTGVNLIKLFKSKFTSSPL